MIIFMEISQRISSNKTFEMQTEEDYRKIANSYKKSAEYTKMIHLYPVLQATIKNCKSEMLIK